jgi:hypothetical protein
MLSGICCAAITNIEMANANAASMKVSRRVISNPRKRNPRSCGSASRSAGSADEMSSCRAFTRLAIILQYGPESVEYFHR